MTAATKPLSLFYTLFLPCVTGVFTLPFLEGNAGKHCHNELRVFEICIL